MSPQRIRNIKDGVSLVLSIVSIATVILTAAAGYGKLESQAEAANARIREVVDGHAKMESDVLMYMRSIDQRLSRIEGRLEKP